MRQLEIKFRGPYCQSPVLTIEQYQCTMFYWLNVCTCFISIREGEQVNSSLEATNFKRKKLERQRELPWDLATPDIWWLHQSVSKIILEICRVLAATNKIKSVFLSNKWFKMLTVLDAPILFLIKLCQIGP